ncbi:MAG TPA: ABC transporter ATP-binding protein [Aggregatilineales bacterium]|nr:ABC transporter ATP-binding protein [Anaerolineales bacterium]HRE49556.1 ABC transporter ATP-binding protein [Aggregatilineales bacterium]
MIEAQRLTKDFDDFRAVDSIDFTIAEGQLFAFLGPNGAGKTTTIRMLTSILKPTSGWAKVAGYDVVSQAPYVRANVGVLTEQHGLYERMRALEYLDFFGKIYRLSAEERRRRSLNLMERFGLTDALGKRIGEYSKGMKQKLALVRALLHNPPILLFDEPTSAMDPQSAKLVRDAIAELKSDKRTIILTTHNLAEAQLLADRVGVIRHGRLIANGSFADLSRRFVGDPIMEVRFSAAVNGATESIGTLAEITETGEDWLRYRTTTPETTNPAILKRLVTEGNAVVTLSEVPHSLEMVYLQIVAEDEGITEKAQS